METGRDNINNDEVLDGVNYCDLNEYFSHELANAMNQENRNEWVLVTRSRNGKKRLTT